MPLRRGAHPARRGSRLTFCWLKTTLNITRTAGIGRARRVPPASVSPQPCERQVGGSASLRPTPTGYDAPVGDVGTYDAFVYDGGFDDGRGAPISPYVDTDAPRVYVTARE